MSGLTVRARRYLTAILVGGAIAGALACVAFVASAPSMRTLVVLMVGVALAAAMQARPPTLVIGRGRLSVDPDEAVLLVAFLLLAPAAVVLLAGLGVLIAEIAQRKPPLKLAFNVSVNVLGASASAAVFLWLQALGAPAWLAVLSVPLVASALTQTVVSGLLNLLHGDPLRNVLRMRLLVTVAVTSAVGTMMGALAVGLYLFHPAATLLLVPAAFLARKAIATASVHENELRARRALTQLHQELLLHRDEDAIVAATLHACREAFAPLACEVRYAQPGAPPRTWSSGERADGACEWLAAPIVARDGQHVGEVRLALRRAPAWQEDLSRSLIALVAGSLSLAFANARAARALAHSEHSLRVAFDASHDAKLLFEPSGRITCLNRAAREFAGASSFLDVETFESMLDPISAPFLRQALAHDGATGEIETRGADAQRRILEIRSSRMRLDQQSEGVLVVLRDVTHRRRLEQEAELQREALARAERLAGLGILVAGVAHEVNNPLMYMNGTLDMIAMDLDDLEASLAQNGHEPTVPIGEIRERLARVQGGADRIGRITKALKVVARSASPAEHHDVELGHVLREVQELVLPTLPSRISLRVSLDERLVVHAHEGELHQIFLNLIKNSVEALSERGGRVEVEARAEGEHVVVQVADDGPGIPLDVQARLFTPFFTTKAEGTGLGLSMVHTAVRNHGGTVEVVSASGRGARFTVRLPRGAASRSTHQQAPA